MTETHTVTETKVLVIFSGGLDSTVLLYEYLSRGAKVEALSFNYGQRHRKELNAAKHICDINHIPHDIIQMPDMARLLPGSSQTDVSTEVPEGHYEEESMKQTVVPNRNMVMLSIAAAVALARGIDVVAFGAHGGDHAIYPDCRPAFVLQLNRALAAADWKLVQVEAPFLRIGLVSEQDGSSPLDPWNKSDIVRCGHMLGVPFHMTWTCYKGLEKHCGKCGSCRERKDAFKDAGVIDPTLYEV